MGKSGANSHRSFVIFCDTSHLKVLMTPGRLLFCAVAPRMDLQRRARHICCNFHGERDDKPSNAGSFPNIWRQSHLLLGVIDFNVNHQTLVVFPKFRTPKPFTTSAPNIFVWFHPPKKIEKHFLNKQMLVGGLEHFLFSHILGIIIPIDFHIFQRGSNHQPECGFSPDFHQKSPPFGAKPQLLKARSAGALRGLGGLRLGLPRVADGRLRQAAGGPRLGFHKYWLINGYIMFSKHGGWLIVFLIWGCRHGGSPIAGCSTKESLPKN